MRRLPRRCIREVGEEDLEVDIAIEEEEEEDDDNDNEEKENIENRDEEDA